MRSKLLVGGPKGPLLVTGVQSVGAKGVNSVQVAAVDSKDVARASGPTDNDKDTGNETTVKRGEPQPVVFMRGGVPLDQRPVHHRLVQAVTRYRRDGGGEDDENAERR